MPASKATNSPQFEDPLQITHSFCMSKSPPNIRPVLVSPDLKHSKVYYNLAQKQYLLFSRKIARLVAATQGGLHKSHPGHPNYL